MVKPLEFARAAIERTCIYMRELKSLLISWILLLSQVSIPVLAKSFDSNTLVVMDTNSGQNQLDQINSGTEDASSGSMGTLKVTTKPSGAGIFIGDKKYGKSPVEISLPEGAHFLKVKRGKRYFPKNQKVYVTEGETENVFISLTPRQGTLKVTLKDENSIDLKAKIYLKKKNIGRTPYEGKHIIGKTKLKLLYKNRLVFEDKITLKQKKVKKIDTILPSNFSPKPRPFYHYKNWGLRSKLALGGSLLSGLAYSYFKLEADKSFQMYQESTDRDEVDQLRQQTEEYDTNQQAAGISFLAFSAVALWSMYADTDVMAYYAYGVKDEAHSIGLAKHIQ